jgi:hypothetical protein
MYDSLFVFFIHPPKKKTKTKKTHHHQQRDSTHIRRHCGSARTRVGLRSSTCCWPRCVSRSRRPSRCFCGVRWRAGSSSTASGRYACPPHPSTSTCALCSALPVTQTHSLRAHPHWCLVLAAAAAAVGPPQTASPMNSSSPRSSTRARRSRIS